MLTIDSSIPTDNQPINQATIMGENRYITDWVTPDSLEIEEKYKQLTTGIADQKKRIIALWNFVKNIPYTQFVKSRIQIDGKSFSQSDTWLEPAQALVAGRLNCFNKSVLLTSLLRQELSPDQAFVCLNNVNVDGVDGHAVSYIKLEDDYILETTNPGIKSPFMPANAADIYDAVSFFNDERVSYVPEIKLREPLGLCCISWLEEYINERLCTEYV
jgi:hypothetical protein